MIINKKKVVIGLIIIAIAILAINIADNNRSTPTIENYLKSNGFTNEGESTLYYKQISDINRDEFQRKMNNKKAAIYETIYFNTANNQLNKTKMTYEDGIYETFSPTYDYANQKLTYNHRFVYNNANVIFEGDYNLKSGKFTCKNNFHYKFDIEEGKDYICNKIKYDVEDFKEEAQNLIANKELLKKLKK